MLIIIMKTIIEVTVVIVIVIVMMMMPVRAILYDNKFSREMRLNSMTVFRPTEFSRIQPDFSPKFY